MKIKNHRHKKENKMNLKKIVLITAILGTTLFANMATSAVKHKVKHDVKHETKGLKHNAKKKTDLNVDKKIKKEKRKMEVKAVKAVL